VPSDALPEFQCGVRPGRALHPESAARARWQRRLVSLDCRAGYHRPGALPLCVAHHGLDEARGGNVRLAWSTTPMPALTNRSELAPRRLSSALTGSACCTTTPPQRRWNGRTEIGALWLGGKACMAEVRR
jgi:hypothetical protein